MALRSRMSTRGERPQRIDPALGGLDEKVRAATRAARDPGRGPRRRWFAAGWASGAVEGYYIGSRQEVTPSRPEGDDPDREQH